tara:strand:+ start:3921 stop:4442 length:522 start_codon:yes stop_codon:yes gene_type:complete
MSDVLMDLHAHYKAVRARLNAGPPPKPLPLPEPAPEPVAAPPVTPPLTDFAYAMQASQLLQGLRCAPEIKEKILPILERHLISWKDAAGKSQMWKYTKCRFEIYVKLYAHGWSLSQIGRLCGDRDHTTVLNGIKKFIRENMTEAELGMCKDLGMRPVDYWEAKVVLTAMGRMG